MDLKINNKKITGKMIAAAITLLLGIILAIGYPTGGVKAHKKNYSTNNFINKSNAQQPAKTNVVIKKKVHKKRVIQPVAPTLNNNSDDEGC